MVKTASSRFFAGLALAILLLPSAASAAPAPFSVVQTGSRVEGVDRIFTYRVANGSDHELDLTGKVVLLDVYSASPAVTVGVPETRVAPGGTADFSVRWNDAPLFGRLRALVVLNDGDDPLLIETFSLTVFPLLLAGAFAAALLVIVAIALILLRRPKRAPHARPKPNRPTTYVTEPEDTVMALSVRFDVTWQDLVAANRLKAPYTLTPGTRLVIPRHALRHPLSDKTA